MRIRIEYRQGHVHAYGWLLEFVTAHDEYGIARACAYVQTDNGRFGCFDLRNLRAVEKDGTE
jgi:hypothetical protein